jgi:hypothetical protein
MNLYANLEKIDPHLQGKKATGAGLLATGTDIQSKKAHAPVKK